MRNNVELKHVQTSTISKNEMWDVTLLLERHKMGFILPKQMYKKPNYVLLQN